MVCARARRGAGGRGARERQAAANRDAIRPAEDQTSRPIAATKEDWFTADHEAAGSDDLCFDTASTPDESSGI